MQNPDSNSEKQIQDTDEYLDKLKAQYHQQRHFYKLFIIVISVVGTVLLGLFIWQGMNIHKQNAFRQQQFEYNDSIFRDAKNAVMKISNKNQIKDLEVKYGMKTIFQGKINDIFDQSTVDQLNLTQFTDLTGAQLGTAVTNIYFMQYPYQKDKFALICFNSGDTPDLIKTISRDEIDLNLCKLQKKLIKSIQVYEQSGQNAEQVNKLITEYRNY